MGTLKYINLKNGEGMLYMCRKITFSVNSANQFYSVLYNDQLYCMRLIICTTQVFM